MNQSNTPEQKRFFQLLAQGDHDGILTSVAKNPAILDSFDYGNFGATPLTTACFSNQPRLVELLIELGADLNRKSDWYMGPWSPLHCAIFRGDKTLANFLLLNGAVLDLHTAAGLGDGVAVVRLLDNDPASVNARGGDGCQPLHFADTIEIAALLLDRGAELDGRCIDHFSTPVQYLCTTRPDVARYLLSVGAQPDIFSSVVCGDIRMVEKLLSADSSLIHARINQSFFPPGGEYDVHNTLTYSIGLDSTPMHAAAKGNGREAVELLVRQGLSPNVRGGYDNATPLHTAAWSNCLESACALLDNGADIDARSGNLHNNSPAGWAIVSGADSVFELLMDRGAPCHRWFLDDARDGCAGRFDQVSCARPEQRQSILSRILS